MIMFVFFKGIAAVRLYKEVEWRHFRSSSCQLGEITLILLPSRCGRAQAVRLENGTVVVRRDTGR
jgi:hypothetical protein